MFISFFILGPSKNKRTLLILVGRDDRGWLGLSQLVDGVLCQLQHGDHADAN